MSRGRELTRGTGRNDSDDDDDDRMTTLAELRVTSGATLEALGRLRGGMPVVKGGGGGGGGGGDDDKGGDGGGGGGGTVGREERARDRMAAMKARRTQKSLTTLFLEWLPKLWEELNENDKSLYMFSQRSRMRKAVWRLIKWKWFDRLVRSPFTCP